MSLIQKLKNAFTTKKADYSFRFNLDFSRSSHVKLSLLADEPERIFLGAAGYRIDANLRLPAPMMGPANVALVDIQIELEQAPAVVGVGVNMGWLEEDQPLQLLSGTKNVYYGTIRCRLGRHGNRTFNCELNINHLG